MPHPVCFLTIFSGFPVRLQTQNRGILTSNAPRSAREPLDEGCECISVGEGAARSAASQGALHWLPEESFPDAFAQGLVPFLNAEITHFDADCAEVRAGALVGRCDRVGAGGASLAPRQSARQSQRQLFPSPPSPPSSRPRVATPLAISVLLAVR
jgi:hypothetical protein